VIIQFSGKTPLRPMARPDHDNASRCTTGAAHVSKMAKIQILTLL
jgi:hypothetical protein